MVPHRQGLTLVARPHSPHCRHPQPFTCFLVLPSVIILKAASQIPVGSGFPQTFLNPRNQDSTKISSSPVVRLGTIKSFAQIFTHRLRMRDKEPLVPRDDFQTPRSFHQSKLQIFRSAAHVSPYGLFRACLSSGAGGHPRTTAPQDGFGASTYAYYPDRPAKRQANPPVMARASPWAQPSVSAWAWAWARGWEWPSAAPSLASSPASHAPRRTHDMPR